LLQNEDFDSNKAWREILGKLESKPPRISWFRNYYRYAAIIIFTLIIGGALSYRLFTGTAPVKMNEVVAPFGSLSSVTLSDGSKVTLNAGSSLKYRPSFGVQDREVHLVGEAWFDVEENKQLPFVVHAAGMKVTVLGTSFVVSSYPEEQNTRTFLERGSVELEMELNGSKVKIVPGEEATLNKASNHLVVEKNLDPNIGSWRYGRISFYKESFDEIARKLERRFCIDFAFENEKLEEMKLTAEFEKEGINQIINYLEVIADVKIAKQQDTYLISPK
jgi:ferric-dicitrate binding protein FerR (iron transport regulator)